MNNLSWDETTTRVRNKSLLIVKGNHEKINCFGFYLTVSQRLILIWMMCGFMRPIYMLYDDMKNEYGDDWDEIGCRSAICYQQKEKL